MQTEADREESKIEGKTAGGIFYRRTKCTSVAKEKNVPVLVLIMGFGGSLRAWPERFVRALARDFDVITFDNRGTGLSIVPVAPEEYTIKAMAADLDLIMETLSVDRFHLLGFSMGGCIAIDYATLYPGKVQSLFLLATTAGGTMFTPAQKEVALALTNPKGRNLWEIYLYTFSMLFGPESFIAAQDELRKIYEASRACPTGPLGIQGHSHAFRNFDASSYVADLKMPVTLMSGLADRMVPPINSERMAAVLPQAKLVLIEKAEHSIFMEVEEQVVDEIKSLISETIEGVHQ